LDVQEDKLREAGCTKIFKEKRSGRQAENRPDLQAALGYVREGDQLVITKLDRMARSILDLAKVNEMLAAKGVVLRVLDQAIDTGTPEGRLMFSLLGAFAEFENDIRRERVADGIAKARQLGVKFGRKKLFTEDQRERIRVLREVENFTVPALAQRFGCGVASIYRALAPSTAIQE
jgi:DNA invertase Pin-like site-specific DNA recombinase